MAILFSIPDTARSTDSRPAGGLTSRQYGQTRVLPSGWLHSMISRRRWNGISTFSLTINGKRPKQSFCSDRFSLSCPNWSPPPRIRCAAGLADLYSLGRLQVKRHHAQDCTLSGRVSDLHFTTLHAMLMPSSEGERHGTHAGALSPLSHRPSHQGRQDQGRPTTLQVPKRGLSSVFVSA